MNYWIASHESMRQANYAPFISFDDCWGDIRSPGTLLVGTADAILIQAYAGQELIALEVIRGVEPEETLPLTEKEKEFRRKEVVMA